MNRTSRGLFFLLLGASLLLYVPALSRPVLLADDFQILAASWTWPTTTANLWRPANEHAMPLGRLSTWLLIQLAGRQTNVPTVCFLQALAGILAALVLVYHFVRRELGHPYWGLLAMAVFGVTSVYVQAVVWFAAGFSVLALDFLLLALLACQRWRNTGAWWALAAAVVATALAPAWFASGVLAGPVCCVYLLSGCFRNLTAPTSRRPWLWAFTPFLGTAAFLAVSLPRTAAYIMHLEHYGDKTALESFGPLVGLGYTCRSVVENLVFGSVGAFGVLLPGLFLWLGGAAVAVLAVWWLAPPPHTAPRIRLTLLGLALIFLSYWLAYSARAEWSYVDNWMTLPNWSRYHLVPQLGLALLVCAGLAGREGRWLTLRPGELSREQVRGLMILTAVLFVCQLPRALYVVGWYDPEQPEVLRRIEDTDRRCREEHISTEAARSALGWLEIPSCGGRQNGWDFLWGSDRPREMSADEIRRRLEK